MSRIQRSVRAEANPMTTDRPGMPRKGSRTTTRTQNRTKGERKEPGLGSTQTEEKKPQNQDNCGGLKSPPGCIERPLHSHLRRLDVDGGRIVGA